MIQHLIRRNKKLYDYLAPRYWHIIKYLTKEHSPKDGIVVNLKKDSYKGERCFIIGGGPSINNMDLTKLNGEHCFAVNRGYLLKEKGLDQVDFYCIADIQASKEYGANIDKDFSKYFVAIGNGHFGDRVMNNCSYLAIFGHGAYHKQMKSGFFQFDIQKPLALSRTVVLHALQVAVYLGFKDIYFIGVDNNFTKNKNIHWYQDSNQEKINIARSIGAFEKENEQSFKKAYEILKHKNIHIYNAGLGGDLNSIPRVDFESLFVKENDNSYEA